MLRHKASVRGAKSDRAFDTRAQLQLAHSSTVGSTVDSANLHTDRNADVEFTDFRADWHSHSGPDPTPNDSGADQYRAGKGGMRSPRQLQRRALLRHQAQLLSLRRPRRGWLRGPRGCD